LKIKTKPQSQPPLLPLFLVAVGFSQALCASKDNGVGLFLRADQLQTGWPVRELLDDQGIFEDRSKE
jgi:hypothetical protein